jgi:toxin ParE1/3/4
MLEILIRPRAREDLKAIWRYSLRQWGERLADSYLQELDRGVRSPADFPDLGVPCDQIRPGVSKAARQSPLDFLSARRTPH